MADAPRILVADGQPYVLTALRLRLKGEGFETVSGSVETLEPSAPVLGVLPRFAPAVAVTQLEPGDLLAMYSEGGQRAVRR